MSGADVVIDFSTAIAAAALAPRAAESGVALVVGTTGLDEAAQQALSAASLRVPVVRSANMSLGVNVLLGLLPRVSGALRDYDAEIVEVHHRMKKDAPSGTALMMEQAVAAARGLDPIAARKNGREGMVGQRTDAEIGLHAVRGGDVVGEHTAYFFGPGERIEISHRATDRGIFARGAVRAAQWVSGRPPGGYDMQDVLGLRA
jgi:4-hydroxy-tetrahydrodipicolinate reductase